MGFPGGSVVKNPPANAGDAFFPFQKVDFGFQVAVYYSYATNTNKSYDINGLNNLGFKLGIAF